MTVLVKRWRHIFTAFRKNKTVSAENFGRNRFPRMYFCAGAGRLPLCSFGQTQMFVAFATL